MTIAKLLKYILIGSAGTICAAIAALHLYDLVPPEQISWEGPRVAGKPGIAVDPTMAKSFLSPQYLSALFDENEYATKVEFFKPSSEEILGFEAALKKYVNEHPVSSANLQTYFLCRLGEGQLNAKILNHSYRQHFGIIHDGIKHIYTITVPHFSVRDMQNHEDAIRTVSDAGPEAFNAYYMIGADNLTSLHYGVSFGENC